MDMKDAAELRAKWDGSPCEHANLAKEFYSGSPTGDYVCTKCGSTGWGKDWATKEVKESHRS
ncbi:hypothetical protein LA366_02610 [Aeromonas jandaei]|uniref:Uncharacterized protein n=1 Tax=Aeromonas jandaei TaxID=650 RepID=A0A7T4DP91_AERJA|nr:MULTISPECIES: hypothetical protein [Aeromonas]MCQ4052344.1 hypothetical protein [Aeromonas sp. SG16]QQB19326.1 hypothetical protein I6H43_17665 [Aeromonas jandaei]UCA34000.1 hypothetical protein LA366_02610 [Aeromonas jandaei]